MEKSGNRNVQPSSRGLNSDSKKNQDGLGGKVWPRGGHRREPPGSNVTTKPQPQRGKTLDKRPKQRRHYPATALANRPSTSHLNDDEQSEIVSVYLPESKKHSHNQLLNFVYAPRDFVQHERGPKKGTKQLMVTKKHKYNKEHFLQANCQFVVNETGDYKQYMANPDAFVDWSLIEQVNIQVSEFPSCPICLYPPVAAKITRCGHIYCWSCILHYLALSDKTWRKCPICYDAIHKTDLKSVIAIAHATFNVNETITFKLMKRIRGSLIACPADIVIKDDVLYNVSEHEEMNIYSKLLLANQSDIKTIIGRERSELDRQLSADQDCPERCFIEQALEFLNERDTKVVDAAIQQDFSQLSLNDDQSVEQPNCKACYFYQAADGQHIYLHAINARMLEHTYGSLEFSPKILTGRILEKEGGSMTEDIRKRLRYLQHLPLTCQFEIAEIQLKQPIVLKDTINFFQEQIDVRRIARECRAKEEKRREKRIADEENRILGNYPAPIVHLDPSSYQEFPEFDGRLRTESECTQPSERSSSPELPSSLPIECSGPSFASMLASEKRNIPSWPTLKPSTSTPPKLINVTGSKMQSTIPVRNHNDDNVEDYELVPQFNNSLGDVVAQALQNVVKDDSLAECGKKKKKKNKQKILFCTNMTYSG